MLNLRLSDVEPVHRFHAALVHLRGGRNGTPHQHQDFCEFFYVVDGIVIHDIRGARRTLLPGAAAFIATDETHSVHTPAGSTARFINVALAATLVDGVSSAAGQSPHAVRAQLTHSLPPDDVAPFAAREALFRAVLADYQTADGSFAAVRFLAALLDQWSAASSLPTSTAPRWLTDAMREMRAPGALREGMPHFRRIASVTQAHLNRTTVAYFGMTASEWLDRERLTRAAMLLATSTVSVDRIAHECGLSGSSYLARRFRARYGMTPLQYRHRGGRDLLA
jgi:AraC family cel operon transcriptional repressor